MKATRVLLAVTALAIALLFPPTGGLDEAKAIIPGGGGPAPANFNFDAPSRVVGTPPTNHDFETGNLTEWDIISGSPSVQPGGPGGYYLELMPGDIATSSAFSVPSDAQRVEYQISLGDADSSYQIRVLWGPSFGTVTTIENVICGNPFTWEEHTRTFQLWAGETVKLQIRNTGSCEATPSKVKVDDVGVMRLVFPRWTIDGASPTSTIELRAGGPSGQYAYIPNDIAMFILSEPFVVPAAATRFGFKAKCDPPATNRRFNISYAILTGRNANPDTWIAFVPYSGFSCDSMPNWTDQYFSWLSMYDIAGEQIKLRLEVIAAGVAISIDEVGFNLREELETQGVPPTTAGDPFQVTTGAITHSHTDIAIPGRGVPLQFTRYYNSQSSYSGALGYRWNHTYSMSLEEQDDDDVIVRYDSGGSSRFGFVPPEQPYTAPSGNRDTLVKHTEGTFTLTTTSQIDYGFNSSGRLDSIADRNGNTTNLYYDGNGRLDYVEDPGLRKLTFSYDASDRIIQITDPLPSPDTRTVGFVYDPATRDLTDVTDVKGGVTTYTYSSSRLETLTDSNGNIAVQNCFNDTNRVYKQFNAPPALQDCDNPDPGVATTLVSYDTPGDGQTTVTDPRDNDTIYTFDSAFRTTDVQDALSSVVHYDFDTNNNISCVTDQRGNKTGFSYDSMGNVTQIIDALNTDTNCDLVTDGDTWDFTYTALNDIDLETDPLDRDTDYVYDGDGNLTEVIRKDDQAATVSRTCFTPDEDGLVTELIQSTTLTDCTGNKAKLEYDTFGNQTAAVNARFSGQPTPPKTTLTYDLGGRLEDVTNELSHTTTYTYDAQNNVLTVADNLGNTTSNTYDDKGNLKTVTDANRQPAGVGPEIGAQCGTATTGLPLDDVVSFTNLSGATVANLGDDPDSPDANWATATTVADTLLRAGFPTPPDEPTQGPDLQEFRVLLRKDAAGGNDPTYDLELWETGGGAPLATLASGVTLSSDTGEVVSVTWDATPLGTADGSAVELVIVGARSNGSPSNRRTVEVGAVRWNVNYADPSGTGDGVDDDSDTVTDDGCPSVVYNYDSADRLVEVIDAPGQSTTYSYDANGNRTSVTNARGKTTTYTYDDLDRLETVTDPLSRVTLYEYDAGSNLSQRTDAKRQPVGPPETGADCGAAGAGNDEDEDSDTVPDDGCPTAVYTYDALSRLTRLDYSDDSVDYTYDEVGNRTEMIDATGTTTYVYDDLDRPTLITPPADTDNDGVFDIVDNCPDTPNPAQEDTGDADGVGDACDPCPTNADCDGDTVLDGQDNCPSDPNPGQENTDADLGAAGANYDGIPIGDDLGDACDTDDDDDGYSDLLEADPADPTPIGTTPGDNCTNVSRSGPGPNTDAWPSDMNVDDSVAINDITGPFSPHFGAVEGVDPTGTDPGDYNPRVDLNQDGAIAINDTTGQFANDFGKLCDTDPVPISGPTTVSYLYDNVGNRSRITYPDGKLVNYTYDEAGNLKTVTDWLSKQTVYTYDDAGILTKTQLPNGAWTDFGYDIADRLTSVDNKNGGGAISSFDYTLDAAGNRTGVVAPDGAHTYEYDDLYRLTEVTYPDPQTDTYTYDAVGNRLSLDSTSYTYDDADQMLTAGGVTYGYDANGNQTSRGSDTFTYDHENRLTGAVINSVASSSTYNGDGLRMNHTVSGVTTNYAWDVNAGLPVILQDSQGNTYVYGLDLISRTDSAGVQEYYLYDGLGSTTDLLDGVGSVLATYQYDVFGAIRAQTGASPNEFTYTGEQVDSSGLQYLRARYYDPEIGRFLSQDPVPAVNLYAYVGNNPVNYVDPSGLSAQEGGNFDQYIAFAGTTCMIAVAADGPFPFGDAACVIVVVPITIGVYCVIFCNEGISEIGKLIGILNSDGGGGRYAGDPRTAGEIISQEKKGRIWREWPGEWTNSTWDEIAKAAEAGVERAKRAKKMLGQKKYDKYNK